jgi:hypothetical protein
MVLSIIANDVVLGARSEVATEALEDIVCSLGLSFPVVRNFYRYYILEQLREAYPRLPEPEIRGCHVYRLLIDHFKIHQEEVLGDQAQRLSYQDADRYLRTLVSTIVRSAALAALFKAGLLSTKT